MGYTLREIIVLYQPESHSVSGKQVLPVEYTGFYQTHSTMQYQKPKPLCSLLAWFPDFQHVTENVFSSSIWEMGMTVTYEAKPLLITQCILGVRCVTQIFHFNSSWVRHFIKDTDISSEEIGAISNHAYGSLQSNSWSVLEEKFRSPNFYNYQSGKSLL